MSCQQDPPRCYNSCFPLGTRDISASANLCVVALRKFTGPTLMFAGAISVYLQLFRVVPPVSLRVAIPLHFYRSSSQRMDSDHGRETEGDAGQETISCSARPQPSAPPLKLTDTTFWFDEITPPSPDILHCPCHLLPSTRLDNLHFPQPSEHGFSFKSLLRSSWHVMEGAALTQVSFLRLQIVADRTLLFFPQTSELSAVPGSNPTMSLCTKLAGVTMARQRNAMKAWIPCDLCEYFFPVPQHLSQPCC